MSSAINLIFIAFLVTAILVGGYSDRLESVSEASFQSAKTAVTLAIDLIGTMALWLGLVRVLEAGGLMYTIALALKPLMLRLFPDVPPQHPAMGAMILNFAANLLGLGNAATPMGIKAMLELNKLNPFPGRATNAMCLFLAINTSSITIFPLTVIGMRAAANSSSPAAIWLPTLLATITSTVVAILVCLAFTRNEPIVTPNSEDLDEENGLIEVDKGSREQGAGSREQGAGSREQGAGGRRKKLRTFTLSSP
ncbi:nucleoside recognition domain-containing protein [Gloeocapsa sp. PCC 73106]|uniref:nucleoside recognition domain-containing protein n=1 Tax=Gloeocapsa sp. PCC 73106 TaxID=102232 RepID=UPI0002ACEB2B|nr:nucleoside recognition domain-containing protein [Gloeocapsa sp. PCC 73106]ELR99236.1 putative membrane protein required for spore maturation [Gloeocapsa sp. PCC 73106]